MVEREQDAIGDLVLEVGRGDRSSDGDRRNDKVLEKKADEEC